MQPSSLVQIGIITSAHGIRGQVKLHSYTTPPDAFFSCKAITNAKGTTLYSLTKQGTSGKLFIVSIHGVIDRNAAELLKGLALYAPATDLPEDPLNVMLHQEARLKDGSAYGVVVDVANFGAGDVIEIERPDGTLEMLPFDERFVESKDGYVLVHPPEYLDPAE
ncbi:MAG: ribosome maturation factor RimM [Rickettsiales bacterium]|nr:ribosome maturation factor RimM [Rickettsiales bacterium]